MLEFSVVVLPYVRYIASYSLHFLPRITGDCMSVTRGGLSLQSRDSCARVEPFAGRKSPNMFAFLLSEHRPMPPDVQPGIMRRDCDVSNPASSKVQRSVTFLCLENCIPSVF